MPVSRDPSPAAIVDLAKDGHSFFNLMILSRRLLDTKQDHVSAGWSSSQCCSRGLVLFDLFWSNPIRMRISSHVTRLFFYRTKLLVSSTMLVSEVASICLGMVSAMCPMKAFTGLGSDELPYTIFSFPIKQSS